VTYGNSLPARKRNCCLHPVSTSTSRPHSSRHQSPQQPPLQHQLLFQTIRLTSSCFHLQGRSSSTNFTHPILLHIAVPAPALYLRTSQKDTTSQMTAMLSCSPPSLQHHKLRYVAVLATDNNSSDLDGARGSSTLGLTLLKEHARPGKTSTSLSLHVSTGYVVRSYLVCSHICVQIYPDKTQQKISVINSHAQPQLTKCNEFLSGIHPLTRNTFNG